jgi:hypothetical protein
MMVLKSSGFKNDEQKKDGYLLILHQGDPTLDLRSLFFGPPP